MSWKNCSRLDEVRQALLQGRWPGGCAAELHAHVQECRRCAQEILLTKHFQLARAEAMQAARTEAGGLLWWRAQARRRNAAVERAGRLLAVAHVFALVIILAAMVGAIVAHWQGLLNRVLAMQWTPRWSLTTMSGDRGLAPLIAGLGVIAMLGGIVAYLTSERL